MSVLPAFISVNSLDVWYLQKPEEDTRAQRTAVRDSCEPPCECLELNQVLWKGIHQS